MEAPRLCVTLAIATIALVPCAAEAQASLAAHAGAPTNEPSVAAEPAGLGPEAPALAAIREIGSDRVAGPATLAEAVDRAATALPAGLERSFAEQVQMPGVTVQPSGRILELLARTRLDHRERRSVASWMRHATRYRARIETILANEGVPTDLVWVAAQESGFNPNDVSAVGATGLWQLMVEPARSYGLRVDAWVDERRDPDRSTHTAASFLRDLHARFGTWELALAAYNMGYNALLRTMRKYNTNDFESLASLEAGLPFETTQYVPRILAGAIAAHNAGLFGITVHDEDRVIAWDDAQIRRSVPLDALAHAMGIAAEDLRALNPAVLHGRTPIADDVHPFTLHVPRGMRAQAELAASQLSIPATRAVRLRHGESVDEVAARYGVTASDVLALSGFPCDQRLDTGTEILVPNREPVTGHTAERPMVPIDDAPHAPNGRTRTFYRVAAIEDVDSVAHALGVHASDLLAWNRLDDHARLQPGMWLQAFLSGPPPDARVWHENEVDLVQRGSEEFYDRTVESDGRMRVRVDVHEGDTMASIAARYGVSTGSLARINHRSRHEALASGDVLIVYAARTVDPATSASAHAAPSATTATAASAASPAPGDSRDHAAAASTTPDAHDLAAPESPARHASQDDRAAATTEAVVASSASAAP